LWQAPFAQTSPTKSGAHGWQGSESAVELPLLSPVEFPLLDPIRKASRGLAPGGCHRLWSLAADLSM
jgi:hypothetical protein